MVTLSPATAAPAPACRAFPAAADAAPRALPGAPQADGLRALFAAGLDAVPPCHGAEAPAAAPGGARVPASGRGWALYRKDALAGPPEPAVP